VDVLCEVLELEGISKTDSELQTSALKFKNSRSPPNPLNGCIGAMDGIAIKIMRPNNDLNPAQFYCHKNFYALPLQAVVDSDYRFLYCSLRCVGSTHNALSYSVSGLSRFLRNGGMKHVYWIAGDDAYECTEHIL